MNHLRTDDLLITELDTKMRLKEMIRKVVKFLTSKEVVVYLTLNLVNIHYSIMQGFPSIMIPQLQIEDVRNGMAAITYEEASFVAGASIIAGFFSAFVSGYSSDRFGRWKTINIFYIVLTISWMASYFSTSTMALYVARLLSGISIGLSGIHHVYVAELASSKHRAMFLSFCSTTSAMASVILTSMAEFLHWKMLCLIYGISGIVTYIAFLFIVPESPVSSVIANDVETARKTLVDIRKSVEEAEEELQGIIELHVEHEKWKEATSGCFNRIINLKQKSSWYPLTIVVIYMIFQQLSGTVIIFRYPINFFQLITSSLNANSAAVIFSFVRLFMRFVVPIIVNLRKRTLAITSSVSMIITMIALAGWEQYLSKVINKHHFYYDYIPVVIISANIIACSIGTYPLPWILASEIFPQSCRSSHNAITDAVRQIAFYLCSSSFFLLIPVVSVTYMIYAFTLISTLGTIFVIFFLPDTHNESLHDLQRRFS